MIGWLASVAETRGEEHLSFAVWLFLVWLGLTLLRALWVSAGSHRETWEV